MFNRKLKRRIKSLEEYLDLVFKPRDGKYDDDVHLVDGYGGKMEQLNKIIKERREAELEKNAK